MSKLIYSELSDKILDAAFTVHRIAGAGFLESVYEESMCIELNLKGIGFERQKVFAFKYKGHDDGGYGHRGQNNYGAQVGCSVK